MLSGSVFDDVNLSGCTYENVNLSGGTYHNVNLSGCTFDDLNMSGWRVHDVNLIGAPHADKANSSLRRDFDPEQPPGRNDHRWYRGQRFIGRLARA